MLRRTFLLGASAIALAACTGTGTNGGMTLADIVAKLKESCGFVTTWQPIALLAATFVTGFNAAAGAAATVAINVANEIIAQVCGAVKVQAAAQPQALGATAGVPVTVVVNGVSIPGVLAK